MKDILAAVIVAVLLNLTLPQLALYFVKPSENQLQNEALAMMKHHDETKFMSSVIVAVIVAVSVLAAKTVVSN
jgi:cytochrome c oxidase assembly factor CtaG